MILESRLQPDQTFPAGVQPAEAGTPETTVVVISGLNFYELRTTTFRLQTTDYRLRITDYRLQTTDYGIQITEFRQGAPHVPGCHQ